MTFSGVAYIKQNTQFFGLLQTKIRPEPVFDTTIGVNTAPKFFLYTDLHELEPILGCTAPKGRFSIARDRSKYSETSPGRIQIL